MSDVVWRPADKRVRRSDGAEAPEPIQEPEYELPESWRTLDDEPEPAESPLREAESLLQEEAEADDSPMELESVDDVDDDDLDDEIREPGPRRRPTRRLSRAEMAISVLALVSLVEGGLIGWLYARGTRPADPVPAAVASIPVRITSVKAGDVVTVDGREVGVTPYLLSVESGTHEIRVASSPPPAPPIPEAVSARPRTPNPPLTASAPRSGGVRVSSPVEIQVLEGERVIGSSTEGPIVTSAGVHQLDFVNSAFGYRERRAVEFKAGQVTTVNVTPPNGRLNINAVPWAQVSIDGKDAGETPLANLSLPIGSHEIVFRHPQLGEHRETAIVKSNALTRMSVTMAR